jgi:hypothetical protein
MIGRGIVIILMLAAPLGALADQWLSCDGRQNSTTTVKGIERKDSNTFSHVFVWKSELKQLLRYELSTQKLSKIEGNF